MEHTVEVDQQADRASSGSRSRVVSPAVQPVNPIFQLQQQAGNQAVQSLLRNGGMQAKLAIGTPDDPEEREADSVADRVVNPPAAPKASSPCSCADGEGACDACGHKALSIQRRATAAAKTQHAPDVVGKVLGASSRPLDAATRAFFEPRLGLRLGEVRLHTDARAAEAARSVQARAFTAGRDVVFGENAYAPESLEGRWLLAHELAHVIQQDARGLPSIQRQQAPPPAPAPTPTPTPGPAPDSQKAGDLPQPGPNTKIMIAPDPKGELVVHTDTNVTFSENVDFVRYQLQFFVSIHGSDRLGAFLSGMYRFGAGLGPFLDPQVKPATPERDAYLQRVIALVRSEAKSLQGKMADFLSDFQRRAVDKLNEMLDASKERVEKERKRYDVKSEDSGHSVETGKETEDLTRRARDLKAKQGPVVTAKAELDRAQPYGPHGELPPGGPPKAAEQDAEAAARQKYSEAQQVYNLARGEAEQRHPILVSYQLDPLGPATAETLSKLGSTSSSVQADTLGAEIDNKLGNIEKVRKDVGDDHTKVWKLFAVVEATKAYPDIKAYPGLNPGVTQMLLAEKAGELQASSEISALFTGIALLIIGLIAAIPTGGLSLAGAAVVATAGVAEAGLMAFTAYQATEKFRFDLAASGTDFDKAKAISEEEPSLFWLALDIIGALVALPKGLSAFRRLVGLRRMAIASKVAGDVAEAEKLLNTLEREGDEIGKAGLGTKLKSETEGLAKARVQHGPEFEEIQRNISKKRPSTMPEYTEEVPLEGDHFWRKSSDGTWCRFSPKPTLCFSGGSIEGRALEEQLIEFEGEQTSRDTLRGNIIDSGTPLPAGGDWQAHHIVPWQLRDHPVVVFVRDKFGWSMNSPENGVALLTKAENAGNLAGKVATHSGSHAAYTAEVVNDLDLLQGRWNDLTPNQIYSEFQTVLDQNRARMIRDLGGAPLR